MTPGADEPLVCWDSGLFRVLLTERSLLFRGAGRRVWVSFWAWGCGQGPWVAAVHAASVPAALTAVAWRFCQCRPDTGLLGALQAPPWGLGSGSGLGVSTAIWESLKVASGRRVRHPRPQMSSG